MFRLLQALMIAALLLAVALVGRVTLASAAGCDVIENDGVARFSMSDDREHPCQCPVGDPAPGDTESPESDDDELDDDCLVAADAEDGEGSPECTLEPVAPTTRPARGAAQRQYRPPRA